jgi:hypothetical protein
MGRTAREEALTTRSESIMDSSHSKPSGTPRHSAIASLKHYARILHRRAQRGDSLALEKLQALRELRTLDAAQISRTIQRRHCLTVSAVRLGFQSWEHACSVLDGDPEDYGTLLYPSSCHGHWNIWSAHYDEARTIRAEHGGYLLAYRRQFLIVERDYIDSLGLDPDDPDWSAIARDWVRPGNRAARSRLYQTLVHTALVHDALREC